MRCPAGISLEGVSRHHSTPAGLVRAVDGITLDIAPGTSVAVTGPSGCGKSTLLGLIAGLEAPSAGRVVVGDVNLSNLSERARVDLRRRRLGLVFQSDNLLPFLTSIENVAQRMALASGAGGADRGEAERPSRLLGELGLDGAAGLLPDQLARGQRQRVAVARALVHRPAVLLADEPTGALDGPNAAAVLELLLAAQRDSGTTLVVVTHDPVVAERLDRVVELRDGRIAVEA